MRFVLRPTLVAVQTVKVMTQKRKPSIHLNNSFARLKKLAVPLPKAGTWLKFCGPKRD